jgi:hypothetical protein
MPCCGPEYNKDQADKDGLKLYRLIRDKFKLLDYEEGPLFMGKLRDELQEKCNELMHLFHKYDSFESF